MSDAASLSLGTTNFKEANEMIRQCLEDNDTLVLNDVFAQRYIGCAMKDGKRLEIHGLPGNDMASYMDGGDIEVFGNAQDQIGNTMNAGRIVVHGRCGDAAGYSMRGGEIYVRDDCGWRVGIHMKQYEDKRPVIVIGGDAGNFLGEYMAGGIIVLLGKVGQYLATGMHGGIIYTREPLSPQNVREDLIYEPVEEEDYEVLSSVLKNYNAYFADELDQPVDENPASFYRLRPASSRPYANMYC
ncbi:MAG: glutamate synthase [Eggerthellaceae bacterium]|nr:glutamate synthase [Eggerthellaceae bacterium]